MRFGFLAAESVWGEAWVSVADFLASLRLFVYIPAGSRRAVVADDRAGMSA